MPLCYEKNKLHALRWRDNNYEKTLEYSRRGMMRHYEIRKDYLKTCRDFRKLTPAIFQ